MSFFINVLVMYLTQICWDVLNYKKNIIGLLRCSVLKTFKKQTRYGRSGCEGSVTTWELHLYFVIDFANLHEKCLKIMITLIITMYFYCFLSIHQVLTVAAIAD